MSVTTSVLIARILGLLYLSIAVGCFSRKDYFRDILKELAGNSLLPYFSGFIALITGALVVHAHNIWQTDWRVLVTIIGWAALVKGILLLAWPGLLLRFMKLLLLLSPVLRMIPWLCALIGLFFIWFGFFA